MRLQKCKSLYAIERKAKEGNYIYEKRCALRKQETTPIVKALGQ